MRPARMSTMAGLRLALLIVASLVTAEAATWQYAVPYDAGQQAAGGEHRSGDALVWLPPQAQTIRGALVGGQLGIELEIALDPAVRLACAEQSLAIVYFKPHGFTVFRYWEPGSSDAERWLAAFAAIAQRTGHPELARVPWISMGHSTAGIFCRNLAYWRGERVAGILQIKSGNFFQKDQRPPNGTLAGIPLLAINGQFERFGPEGGLRPERGRETQWMAVRDDLLTLRGQDPAFLVSQWVDPGADHFHGSPALCAFAARFIAATARRRIPAQLPAGDAPIACLALKPEDGWLSDGDLYAPAHPPAPYRDFAGDRAKALWQFDGEMAAANAANHALLGAHQALSAPVCTWRDEGDGWSFDVSAEFLATMPDSCGGALAGKAVGHAATPITYRGSGGELLERLGPHTFRLLRRPDRNAEKWFDIAAENAGDEHFRPTVMFAPIALPKAAGEAQRIDFPAIGDVSAKTDAVTLRATASSGLAIHYEVDYGPVEIRDGRLRISELPTHAHFPIACQVTANQVGRRLAPQVAPAAATCLFQVVEP